MKVKELFSISKNKKNYQFSYHLKIKELRKSGITPEQLKEMVLLKPKKIRTNHIKQLKGGIHKK